MLNENQKIAVEIIDKPLIVIAGPGTGKTTLITEKIDYLISKKNIKSEEILAITFTEKSAKEMSQRVLNLLNNKNKECEISNTSKKNQENNSNLFTASTFHSFALNLIEEFESKISELDLNYSVINDSNSQLYFLENISKFKFSSFELKNNQKRIAIELASSISKLKDFNISLNNLEKLEFENLNEKIDIFSAFCKYEKYKKDNNFMDFADILLIFFKLLKSNKKILSEIKSRYKYILVDEFQDTNQIQLEIIKLLAENNITIVGDFKQSIYSFRGANYKNLELFKSHYKNYKEIFLKENYRFSKNILNLSNKIINKIGSNSEILKLNSKKLGKVNLIECETENSQETFIIEKISELKEKNPKKTIGVLCRRKSEVLKISTALNNFGLNHYLGEISDFLNCDIIKTILLIIEVISKPKEANSEIFLLLSNLGLRSETIKSISRKASLNEKSIFNVLQKNNLSEYKNEDEIIKKFNLKLKKLIELKNSNSNLKKLILELINSFNLYEKSILSKSLEDIEILNSFVSFSQNFIDVYKTNNLSKFLNICNLSKSLNLSFESNVSNFQIEVLTIHQSKGKEFDFVFIPYLNERRFPLSNKSQLLSTPFDLSKDDFLNEEERLFFVAITRAKSQLYLTYVKRYEDNKLDSKPTRFLENLEITKDNYSKEISNVDFKLKTNLKIDILKKIENLLLDNHFDLAKSEIDILKSIFGKKDLTSFMIEPKTKLELKKNFKKLDVGNEIYNPIEKRIYSVSQVQVYESCPKKYSYQYIYKIPTKPKHYFDFGTSMHTILEHLSKDFEKDYSKEILFAKGIQYLKKYWISKAYENSSQEKEYMEKGIIAIKDYVNTELELKKKKRKTIGREKNFLIEIEGRKFRGVIDRIDEIENGYEILDYKTSNSMEDEKKLKNNTQLLLYSLALKNIYNKFPKKMGLWYLIHNKIKSVEFKKDNLEIAKQKILDLIKGIESSNFKATPTFFGCKFCDFNEICSDVKK